MSPAKPDRLVAIESACIAQARIADAVTGLGAYEAADLEGALAELTLALGRLQEARLAVRRAIAKRDGGVDFPAGRAPLGDLVEIDDKGAQVAMAGQHHARADRAEGTRA